MYKLLQLKYYLIFNTISITFCPVFITYFVIINPVFITYFTYIYPVNVTLKWNFSGRFIRGSIIDDLKKRPRLQFLDTGLLNYQLNKQVNMLQVKDFNEFHQGKIVMQMVTQELKSKFDTPSFKPNFWVREKSNSSAEVDLVISMQNRVFPIEIKSGPKGKLRSLFQFMEQSDHPYATRLLANQFQVEEVKMLSGKTFYLMNLPYYLGGKLPEYINWFVANYPIKKL
ncbi:MAG: DUF4143 domain-containing protein [Cyclobacteriaceae bacterium]